MVGTMNGNGGKVSALVAMALFCALGLCQAQADPLVIINPSVIPNPLVITVATDKPAYVAGELLVVSITAHNPNDSDMVLSFNSGLQAQYTMDGVYKAPTIATMAFTRVSIPPHASHTWSYGHLWAEYGLDIGTHTVVGTVIGRADSQPYSFEVIAPTLPTSDVLIDFENLPDGRAMPGGLYDAYAAWGVHFGKVKSGGMERISVCEKSGNLYAAATSCTYPPGFNMIATFDMPVRGISADVSSAAGMTITMVAKDSDGQIIDSVVSDVVSEAGEFVGSIELLSEVPIASVEWWPSEQNAAVFVDNIHVMVPGSATLSLLTLGGLPLLRRRRR